MILQIVASGHDFKIVKIMEGQWPKYDQSQPRPKSSEAGSKAEVAAWMDSLHDIHALVKLEEYEDVKTAAMGLLPSHEGSMSESYRRPKMCLMMTISLKCRVINYEKDFSNTDVNCLSWVQG